MAADQDLVGSTLGHTGGDGADAGLADQLDVDVSAAVGVFQIVDQLCQILDGVDIVVGRGRDQAHAGGAVAGLCNPRIDLLARQVSALARLCALCHLDLNLFGTY